MVQLTDVHIGTRPLERFLGIRHLLEYGKLIDQVDR